MYTTKNKVIELRDLLSNEENKHLPLYSERNLLSVEEVLKYLMEENKIELKPNSIEEHYWNFQKWIYEEFEGVDFDKQGFIAYQTDKSIPGGNVSLKNGYISLAEHLSKGLEIKLKEKVISIENYSTDKITIKTEKGEVYNCSSVILTVPLGVLKDSSIKFSPPLPDYKQKAIDRLGMGLMNKVALHFPKAFWDKNTSRISFISKIKGEFPWIDNYSFKENILLCWLSCSYSEELEKKSDEEIINKIVEILRKIYGEKKVPKPSSYLISRWNGDPLSRGSWSIRPVGSTLEDNKLLGLACDNLFFAGEATSAIYPSTVTGAFLSGEEVASSILKKIQQKVNIEHYL